MPNKQQWGFQQCLPFSWTTLRGKHCQHPIAVMGVLDTFAHTLCGWDAIFLIFTYLRGNLIEILEIIPKMWQYVIFLSLKPTTLGF